MQANLKKLDMLDGHQFPSSPSTTHFKNDCLASPLSMFPQAVMGRSPAGMLC